MAALAVKLLAQVNAFPGVDATQWGQIKVVLDQQRAMQAEHFNHAPSLRQGAWIAKRACERLVPEQRGTTAAVLAATQTPPPTTLFIPKF